MNRKGQFTLLVIFTLFGLPAFADTTSFEVDQIQQFVQGPNAVHPRENPVGSLHGVARVEFALAYVDDILQFYATVYDSPEKEMSFNVSARIYHDENQLIGHFMQSPTIIVPASSGVFPMGGVVYRIRGNSERLTKSDLENLIELRLEVTWFESNET